MNQFRCKQVNGTALLSFKTLAPSFFTGSVEKPPFILAETVVQLRTSSASKALPQRHYLLLRRAPLGAIELYILRLRSEANMSSCPAFGV